MRIKITLQNMSPLSIRSARDDDVINTREYIPGHSFRGALAAHYLKSKTVDDLFKEYFINGHIRYSPLYPSSILLKKSSEPDIQKIIAIENDITNSNSLSNPFPKTTITCKRWPGFKGMGIRQEQHGVRDQLFEWAIYKLTGQKDVAIITDSSKCLFHDCEENMVSLEGFYKRGENGETSIRKVKTQISMHTGIMHSTGTVSPGILYSIESIQENFQFSGVIDVNDEDDTFVPSFKDFLKDVDIRIGNKKTSGQGLCIIQEISDYEDDDFEKFKKRISKFDSEFKKVAPKELSEGFYFSVNLFSDAILLDKQLNYEISLKNIIPEAKLIYENVSPFRVMGWNSVLRLPKQMEWAIEKGSVAFFRATELTDEFIKTLYNLEKSRIGIRKTEGFGIIRVSDPFHWEVRKNEK